MYIDKTLLRCSFMNSLFVVLYTAGVVWVLSNAESIFDNASEYMIGLFMLLLFVLSAAVTGFLVLGRPALMFMDGKKKQAGMFLGATLIWLVLFLLGVVVWMIF